MKPLCSDAERLPGQTRSLHHTDNATPWIGMANTWVRTLSRADGGGRFVCGWRQLMKPALSSLIAAVQLLDKPHTELIVHHSPYLVLQTIQPTTDPGEIKLRLNIKNRVTTWRIARIGGRGHTFPINHSSVYSLNKYVSVCVRICVPGLQLLIPLALLLTLNDLINLNPFSQLTRPSPWSRRLAQSRLECSLPRSGRCTRTHTHFAHLTRTNVAYTSPFCWQWAHLLQRHNANSCRCLSPWIDRYSCDRRSDCLSLWQTGTKKSIIICHCFSFFVNNNTSNSFLFYHLFLFLKCDTENSVTRADYVCIFIFFRLAFSVILVLCPNLDGHWHSFKMKHRVCVTQLMFLWLQPV